MTGANSKGDDLRRTFGLPSGPGNFLTLIKLSAPCTSRTVENSSSGLTSTLIRDTSAEVSGERGHVRPTKTSLFFFSTQGTQGVSVVRGQILILPHVILRGHAGDIFQHFPPPANISALERFNFPFIELTFTGLYRRLHLVRPHVERWRIFADLREGFVSLCNRCFDFMFQPVLTYFITCIWIRLLASVEALVSTRWPLLAIR